MSKKFEKIEMVVSLETYSDNPQQYTFSALDIIVESLEKEMDVEIISFEQPIEMKLVEIKNDNK